MSGWSPQENSLFLRPMHDGSADIEMIARKIGLTLHDKIVNELKPTLQNYNLQRCIEHRYTIKLQETINTQISTDSAVSGGYPEFLQLLHDRTDYFLGPHTDNPGKLVVFLIYFLSLIHI